MPRPTSDSHARPHGATQRARAHAAATNVPPRAPRDASLARASVGVALAASLASASLAAHEPSVDALEPFRFDPALPTFVGDTQASPDPVVDDPALRPPIVEFTLGTAFDLQETTLGTLRAGYHAFIADQLTVGVFGEAMYVSQDPDDAVGGGIGLAFRWYFLQQEKTDLFVEAGCGIAIFDTDVPFGGSSFDFTPRVALGLSTELDDSTRFVAQIGWLHLSNAQTSMDNPGLDTLAVSLGVSFEF